MAQLPQVLSIKDRLVVGLGLRASDATRLRSFSTSRVDTVATTAIPAFIPEDTRALELVLGSRFGCHDADALIVIVNHVKENCPLLTAVHVTAHVTAWTATNQKLVSALQFHSLESFGQTVIDPMFHSEGFLLCEKRDCYETSSRTFVRLPANFVPLVPTLRDPWWSHNLQDLSISPPIQHIPATSTIDIVAVLNILGQLFCLRRFAFPLDFMGHLSDILHVLSALPNFHVLVLLPPSFLLCSWVSGIIVTDLIGGLRGFHHLWEVTLPLGILCNELLDALASILDLRKLTLSSATSQIRQIYRPAGPGQFPSLRHLSVSGSLTDLANVICACVHAGTSVLKTVLVKAKYLQHVDEARRMLQIVASHCGTLENININIKRTHVMENGRWMDVTLLQGCRRLKTVIIKHPRPLAMSDDNIRCLLLNWPNAQYISFNPRPFLPEWRVTTDSPFNLPTLTCLNHVRHRQIRYFGVYINTSLGKLVNGSSRTELRSLDLGTSRKTRATSKLIRSFFRDTTVL